MLPLFTDLPDPMADPLRAGSMLGSPGLRSEDHDALVLVEADSENLQRLERWIETRPDHVAHLPGTLA